MHWLRIRLHADSPFVTPLRGDTLFGQLCWRIRESQGETELSRLLAGYGEGRPFLVISDPFPADHLPRPAVPSRLLGFDKLDAKTRKQAKGKRWLPLEASRQPLVEWASQMRSEGDIMAGLNLTGPVHSLDVQSHNSINRLTLCTGEGQFAPFSTEQSWWHPGLGRDLYLLHDERVERETLLQWLTEIGLLGYGKDASVGKGRFHVEALPLPDLPAATGAHHWLTLAPCAPQGGDWRSEGCFYTPLVRFGRHGAALVTAGHAFKNPVLLADTGALLTPDSPRPAQFTGQGLGGDGQLSHGLPQTVHQGYAPVIGVSLPKEVR